VHVREQAADFKRLGERFSAQWTPTILIIDHTGTERHRVEGFLPADDLLAELTLGLGHSAFARGEFSEAEERFREVLDRFPNSEVAAEAQYWAGVSRYKATNDAAALGETARQFTQRFQDSTWAKKASVWAK
jgi:outer membrane protein assembly factor BamD (BamD/ComL family)